MGGRTFLLVALVGFVGLTAGVSVNTPSSLTLAPGESNSGSDAPYWSQQPSTIQIYPATRLRRGRVSGQAIRLQRVTMLLLAGACSGIEVDGLSAKFSYQAQFESVSDPSCTDKIR